MVEQCLHQKRYATNLEHVFGNITTARLQISDIWCLFEDFRDVEQIELDADSCAMAGRCSAALVDPPDAATTAAAFCSALRVTMSRGRILAAISSITFSPAVMQNHRVFRKAQALRPSTAAQGQWPPIPSPWCWR